MAASADILSQTLTSITAIKLDELSNQRSTFESQKSALLTRIKNEPNQRKKVEILLGEIENLPAMGKLNDNPLISLKNARQFLAQSNRDPSVTDKILKDTQTKLEGELDIHSLKYEYASLYGHLVEEWLTISGEASADANSDEGRDFQQIGREEMHEQRKTWEEYVFTPLDTDVETIKNDLKDLFTSTKSIAAAYADLQTRTAVFEIRMSENKHHFDEESLKDVIQGLLRTDLVTNEKRKVLKDFIQNKVVLAEIADVLNMRMRALDLWKWDSKGTVVEQRRNLNGRYRFYHDEDLLQMILLRYIGLKWSVHFKQTLTTFQTEPNVWKSSTTPLSKDDRNRRDYFLGTQHTATISVESKRKEQFDGLFLEQLAEDVGEKRGGYDDDEDPEEEKKGTDDRPSGQQLTQEILRTLATEVLMKTQFGEDTCVVRSDFKWFGPSLPHSTMFAVLSFFGVSAKWISFFKRAIEAPMKFAADGEDAPVQIRKRGTPISGPLSDMLGETVLFCLDFKFNQQTDGARLYRLHDDIWFWGSRKACVQGWKAILEFCDLTGLEYNEEKTGYVKILAKNNRNGSRVVTDLPMGTVNWGFLVLDSSGRFRLDEEKVAKHVAELRRQLDSCKSVFEFIRAWNLYAAQFFSTNFAKPAQVFGRSHIDMMLDAFSNIQNKLFSSTGGSISTTLQKMISERFGVKDIPEGYLYFPVSLGGLEVKSPFVNLYMLRESASANPTKYMDDFFELEADRWLRAKVAFDEGKVPGQSALSFHITNKLAGEQFMSFEEYTRNREVTSGALFNTYELLMQDPGTTTLETTADIKTNLEIREYRNLSPYYKWILQLYGPEMIARFGSLNVVEKGLLPTGMVGMFQESQFRWLG